ncbi:hypothetical protein BDW60DRAFT_189279 [Aspergillus nidulans var. acristatus]|jgi:hypothetical protein
MREESEIVFKPPQSGDVLEFVLKMREPTPFPLSSLLEGQWYLHKVVALIKLPNMLRMHTFELEGDAAEDMEILEEQIKVQDGGC